MAVVSASALVGGGIGMLGGVALGAINPFALGIIGAVGDRCPGPLRGRRTEGDPTAVVAEVVWVVSWSVVAAIAGIVSVIVTIVYGEVQRRLSMRQLRLAQEEAGLRPRLTVSLRTVVYHYRPPNPGSKYEQAAIVFDVTNDGRSAAHNVSCEVRLDERHLELDDLHGQNRNLFAPHIGPSATVPHAVNVGVLSVGPTVARYRVVCDAVGESEDQVEFEIPERERDEPEP